MNRPDTTLEAPRATGGTGRQLVEAALGKIFELLNEGPAADVDRDAFFGALAANAG